MIEKNPCNNCGQKDSCGHVYSRLAEYKGPSVLPKVISAFVLPLLVFISSLVILEQFTGINAEKTALRTFLHFGIAAGVTFIFILLLRAFRKHRKNRQSKYAGND